MTCVTAVCGAGDRWGVPAVSTDPQEMLSVLSASHPNGQGDTPSHLLVLTRPSAGAQMRHLATLLRAHDGTRHVAVLESDHAPLALALVAEQVNSLDLGPGEAVERTLQLLEVTSSGWWVRRGGAVSEAKPSLWQVVRSWFSKTGYIAMGSGPVSLTLADADAWAQALAGTDRLVVCGDVSPTVRDNLGSRSPEEVYARELSWGGRAVVGQRSAFEWVASPHSSGPHLDAPSGEVAPCDSCGAVTSGVCPFCHASWGICDSSTAASEPTLVPPGGDS